MLTKREEALIQALGQMTDEVILYEADSLSGDSWTLRYRRTWADPTSVTGFRYESHMILSVRKPVDAKDDAVVHAERMRPKVNTARAIFNALRPKIVGTRK